MSPTWWEYTPPEDEWYEEDDPFEFTAHVSIVNMSELTEVTRSESLESLPPQYREGFRYYVDLSEDPRNLSEIEENIFKHPFKTLKEAERFAIDYMKENTWL